MVLIGLILCLLISLQFTLIRAFVLFVLSRYRQAKRKRMDKLMKNPPKFYGPKPSPDLSQREEIFNAIFPKLCAFYRPRRHSYGVATEIATLLAHILEMPGPERQALLFNRKFLKEAAKKVFNMSKEYESHIPVVRDAHTCLVGGNRFNPGSAIRAIFREHLAQNTRQRNILLPAIFKVDERFLFKEGTAATIAFLSVDLLNQCLEDPKVLQREMPKAQKIYQDWFCEYWSNGKEAAQALLKERTWSPQNFQQERRTQILQKQLFGVVESAIDALGPVATIPPTFHPFSRLPPEIRVKIWKASWEPRVVEIQGSIRHTFFGRMGDNEGNDTTALPPPQHFLEERVLEDEEGDNWFYRRSGKAHHDALQARERTGGMRQRVVLEQDLAEDQKWSARPIYALLEACLNKGALTEALILKFLSRKKVLENELPLPSLCRGLWASTNPELPPDGEFPPGSSAPQPVAPGKRVIQIAGILSKIEEGKCFEDYKWPQKPSYKLVNAIFKKLENGKTDSEILKELQEPMHLYTAQEVLYRARRPREVEESANDEEEDREYDREDEDIQFSSPTPLPLSLHIDRESRAETLKHYELAFNNPAFHYPAIYIDFTKDTVLCVRDTFGNRRLEEQGSLGEGLAHAWVAGFEHIHRDTQTKIRYMAISKDLFTRYAMEVMRDRFTALKELKVILNDSDDFIVRRPDEAKDPKKVRYDLVGKWKTHLAFNAQAPGNDREFFKDPFMRYWDEELWIPGVDGPRGPFDEWYLGGGNRTGHRQNVPGYISVGPEYVKAIQKLPVTFVEPPEKELDRDDCKDALAEWDESAKPGQEDVILKFVDIRRGGLLP